MMYWNIFVCVNVAGERKRDTGSRSGGRDRDAAGRSGGRDRDAAGRSGGSGKRRC